MQTRKLMVLWPLYHFFPRGLWAPCHFCWGSFDNYIIFEPWQLCSRGCWVSSVNLLEFPCSYCKFYRWTSFTVSIFKQMFFLLTCHAFIRATLKGKRIDNKRKCDITSSKCKVISMWHFRFRLYTVTRTIM